MRKSSGRGSQHTKTIRATTALAVFSVLLLLIFQDSSIIRFIDSKTVLPLLFDARSALGKSPDLSSKIHMFAVDDATVSLVGRSDLTLLEWAHIIEIIDRSKPRAILIDALFSLTDVGDNEDNREAVRRLSAIQAPIHTGAFASREEVPGRKQLNLDSPSFDLETFTRNKGTPPFTNSSHSHANTIDYKIAYGAHPSLSSVFSNPGHLHYGDDDGAFFPFIPLRNRKVLTHISLKPFNAPEIDGKSLKVGGHVFPYVPGQAIPVNFPSYSSMMEKVFSLSKLLTIKSDKAKIPAINEGDFVVLIPMFYTGQTDFKPSPIGIIPGAFAHVAVLNEIVEGRSLVFFGNRECFTIGFALIIGLLGWRAKPAQLIIMTFSLTAFWISACVLSFTAAGVILPFLLPQLAIGMVGSCFLLQRIQFFDRNAQIIRTALEGVVRPESLAALERNPERLSLESKERLVTIVFIDIVGFSLMMETKAPHLAFEGLQTAIDRISSCIHKHGGIVNKTLGDGLLCFFGYAVEDDKEISNHAVAALAAALEIQAFSVPQIIADSAQKKPLFPLRIGINTSNVFIGNVGSGERIDMTLIGSGVNHTKRLESACRTNCILVGTGTYDRVKDHTRFGEPHRRFVFIKHHDEQVECWEYDPLIPDSNLIIQAREISEREAVVHSQVQRWNPKSSISVTIHSERAAGTLLNFWSGGLKFESEDLIPRQTQLEVALKSSDGRLQDQLHKAGIESLKLEILTVGFLNDKYIHESKYLNQDGKKLMMIGDFLERLSLK